MHAALGFPSLPPADEWCTCMRGSQFAHDWVHALLPAPSDNLVRHLFLLIQSFFSSCRGLLLSGPNQQCAGRAESSEPNSATDRLIDFAQHVPAPRARPGWESRRSRARLPRHPPSVNLWISLFCLISRRRLRRGEEGGARPRAPSESIRLQHCLSSGCARAKVTCNLIPCTWPTPQRAIRHSSDPDRHSSHAKSWTGTHQKLGQRPDETRPSVAAS